MAWLTPALNGVAPAGMIDAMDSALCDAFVGTKLTESPGITLTKAGSKTIAPAAPEFSIFTVTVFASPGLARTSVRAKIANLFMSLTPTRRFCGVTAVTAVNRHHESRSESPRGWSTCQSAADNGPRGDTAGNSWQHKDGSPP